MNAVVAFPYQKKRGAKTRKGPCAEIIQLHRSKPDLSEDERKTIEMLVQLGKTEQWGRALIEHLRLPATLTSRGYVRSGMTMGEFLGQLRRDRV
jgi:hypothetical protein